jgi:hypothetical protein
VRRLDARERDGTHGGVAERSAGVAPPVSGRRVADRGRLPKAGGTVTAERRGRYPNPECHVHRGMPHSVSIGARKGKSR